MRIPQISVIVPIYNSEKYLHRCLESILKQTFTDFELLLINDGSKDESGAICDEYAIKDSRVNVFHKKNGGVSSARKLGLDKAKCEWVTFIDSDDYIQPQYLLNMMKYASNEFELYVLADNFNTMTSTSYINDLLFDRIPWSMMMKLYKKNSLKESNALMVPKDLNIGEDLIANIILANNISIVKSVIVDGYMIMENDCSVTKTRRWSLDYETRFLMYIRSLLKNKNECVLGFWRLSLKALKNLLKNGVYVSRSHALYKYVLKNRTINIPLGVGDKLVIFSPFPRWTMMLLRILKYFRS